MEKLLPCPFCGEQPIFEYDDELLYCENCYESAGRTVDVVGDSKEELEASWNTRFEANPSATNPVVDQKAGFVRDK